MSIEKRIARTVLDQPVVGLGLQPGSLRDQLADRPTLLLFLRHFGWIFCRETVKTVRQLATTEPDFPSVVFFFQEPIAEGAAFFAKHWPGVRAIADERRFFYQVFALSRGDWAQMVGPDVWVSGLRALLKGNIISKPSGDPRQMPGAFLVQGDRILWEHPYSHAGDQPDFRQMLSTLAHNLTV